MAILLDGKATAAKIKQRIAEAPRKGRNPKLAVILVGDDPASKVYIRNKSKACSDAGIEYLEYLLPPYTQTEEVLSIINELNIDDTVDGILVQLPLPAQIDAKLVMDSIARCKDVDGFQGGYTPCTPKGIMTLLNEYHINLSGKSVVIVGRSQTVGRPLAKAMLDADATVTVCHSKTKELSKFVANADIIVSAIGKQNVVTPQMIKEDAIVIDVGINRNELGKVCGDIDFNAVNEKASFITPVPGGVGPMTIASLIENVYASYNARIV